MTLHFGTAGVRAPLGDGPDRMNAETVTRVATAVARYLRDHHPAGELVVVAGDARHGSERFVEITVAVLRAHHLVVVTPGSPVPTPVLAAAVRARGAVAGVMVTASHNPATDNGIKVYGPGGAQIVPPTDSLIEAHLTALATRPVTATPAPRSVTADVGADGDGVDPSLVDDYVAAVAAGLPSPAEPPRVALTPVHGVGGEVCRRVLAAIGVEDVHVVPEQAAPDPDFPTVSSPNPERPETTERLLALAAGVDADVALALDPDADRCAVGLRDGSGRWRMLDGDDTGAVLADHLLVSPLPGSTGDAEGVPVVASTLVSSRLPSLLVPARGGRHVETPTGFKWLVRAGEPLLYAYEEAIGHCVLPQVVADKDGIATAAAWCAMLGAGGPGVAERLDALADEFGAHMRRNVPLRLGPGVDAVAALDRAAEALSSGGGGSLGGGRALGGGDGPGGGGGLAGLGEVTPSPLTGSPGVRLDVPGARAVIRPSGTEPLLKTYVEAWTPAGPDAADRVAADHRLDALAHAVAAAVTPS